MTPSRPFDLTALGDDVAERLDRFDVTGALDRIWEGVRSLNQYVTAEAPWQFAKDEANAARLDGVLYNLVDGLTAARRRARPVPAGDRAADPRRAPPAGRLSPGSASANGVADEADGIAAAEPLFPRIELPAPAA